MEKSRRLEWVSDASLLLVAIIWGAAFPFQKICMGAGMSTEQCMSVKFVIAAIVVSLVFVREFRHFTKADLKAGAIAGGILFIVNYLTTIGLEMSSSTNTAIIATTYVLLLPFLWFFMGKARFDWRIFGCAVLCIAGLFVINYVKGQGIGLGWGDLIVFIGAIFCAMHIAYIGVAVKETNPKALLVLQMIMCAVCSSISLVATGKATLEGIDVAACIGPMLFVGVLAVGVGFAAQVLAQQYTSPTKAGLLMATEGTFGAIISVILGLTLFSGQVVVGVLLCFVAVMAAEMFSMDMLPRRKKKQGAE